MTGRAVDEVLSGLILGRSSLMHVCFLVSLFSLFACRGDLDFPLSSFPIPGQGAPRYKCPDMGVPWSEICRRHGLTGHGPSRIAHERGGYFPVRKGADRNVTSAGRRTNMWECGGRCDGRGAWKACRVAFGRPSQSAAVGDGDGRQQIIFCAPAASEAKSGGGGMSGARRARHPPALPVGDSTPTSDGTRGPQICRSTVVGAGGSQPAVANRWGHQRMGDST